MGKLITVLIASVIAALLLTLFFVTQFGSGGSYTLNSVLVAPDILPQFNYNDMDPKTGAMDRFVFDSIVVQEGSVEKQLSLAEYAAIYKTIESEKSIEPIDSLFKTRPYVSLIIYSRTESPSAWQNARKEFQKVEISAFEGYFRVELHEDNLGIHWAYFKHEGLYPSVIQKFSK